MKVEVEIPKYTYLLHPRIAVLVTSGTGKGNIMTVAWSTPISRDPPLLGIAVSPRRYSHRLIEEHGEFVINVPTAELLSAVKICGERSGRYVDKWNLTGLRREPARSVEAPVIAECVARVECVVEKRIELGDHTFFVGRVVGAAAEEGAYPEGVLDVSKFKLVLHLGMDKYTTTVDRLLT